MKTLSLEVSKKLKEIGVEIETELWWRERGELGEYSEWVVDTVESSPGIRWLRQFCYPAYTLQDLVPLLKELGRVMEWPEEICIECESTVTHKKIIDGHEYTMCLCNDVQPFTEEPVTHYFLQICSLYTKDQNLGEGSECEAYLLNLVKS